MAGEFSEFVCVPRWHDPGTAAGRQEALDDLARQRIAEIKLKSPNKRRKLLYDDTTWARDAFM